jgi:hypothetical protein
MSDNLELTAEQNTDDFNHALNLIAMITGFGEVVFNGHTYDMSGHYIEIAREALPTLRNPNAIDMVNKVIGIYES